jgi:serine/threonine protein kinase
MDNSIKKCPFCNKKIKATAIKCKHCGTVFSNKSSSSGSFGSFIQVNQALSDKYKIQEKISQGGMAKIYRAIQINLQRPVALKVIHQNLVHDSELITRFHREAQVCTALQHPNIVTVYDEGQLNGVHYMAMELIEGRDLHQIIRQQGKLSVEQTLAFILPIVDALHYAHSQGIIHRDIKSSNILVVDNESHQNARPVLTDFGIAHTTNGVSLTQIGLVIGTPEYMSPEQAEGKFLDQRTDIYSLGIVLYECLTGFVPFRANNPSSIMLKVLNEAPLPPIHLNSQIPEWLNLILLKCLAKNPEDRYTNAEELTTAITKKQKPILPKNLLHKKTEPILLQNKLPLATINQQFKFLKEYNVSLSLLAWGLFLILFFLTGIYGYNYYQKRALKEEYENYYKAIGSNSLAEYSQYLNRYPNGRFSNEINQKLEQFKEKDVINDKLVTAEKLISEQSYSDPFADQMVFIIGGTYIMGCTKEQENDCENDEFPARSITIDDFYIGMYEVTQIQWYTIMGNFHESYFKACQNCPVDRVSWYDTQLFIKRLNQLTGKKYRLPTEAEWEFAARGGSLRGNTKYAGSNAIEDVAWYENNGRNRTHPVGTKKANELGLFDMSGNVWEWCSDWYGTYSFDIYKNPTGSSIGTDRILRGGSWSYNANSCRVSKRSKSKPDNRFNDNGFRLVRSN